MDWYFVPLLYQRSFRQRFQPKIQTSERTEKETLSGFILVISRGFFIIPVGLIPFPQYNGPYHRCDQSMRPAQEFHRCWGCRSVDTPYMEIANLASSSRFKMLLLNEAIHAETLFFLYALWYILMCRTTDSAGRRAWCVLLPGQKALIAAVM